MCQLEPDDHDIQREMMEKFEEGNKVGGQNAPGRVSSVKWNSMGVAVEFFREASTQTYAFIWDST